MAAALTASSFTGVRLNSQRAAARRPAVSQKVSADLFQPFKAKNRTNEDKATVKRAVNSQVVKAKKLLPYDEKLTAAIPGKAKKLFNARNAGDASIRRTKGAPPSIGQSVAGIPIEGLAAGGIIAAVMTALFGVSFLVN